MLFAASHLRWSARAFLSCCLLLAGLTVGSAAPALAAGSSLCSSTDYNVCIDAGYSDHEYGAHSGSSYWNMAAGHNCTNYVAYVEIRNGVTASTHGDAKDWDNNAPSSVPVNVVPAVGAVAQWEAGPLRPSGHVAYVEAVNADGSITISQDNWDGPFGWELIPLGSANWPQHFLHFKDASIASASLITPDGVQHLYTGLASGKVYDTSWGNGAPLTQWQVGTFATPVTRLSAQLVAGIQHVYAATGSTVQDISWGNGAPLTQWQIAAFPSPVTSISSQTTNGVQHVYAATGTGVQQISWGNGVPLTVWQVAGITSITTLSSQIINGVHHVYPATASGSVQDVSWGNGAPLTIWQVASLGSAVTSVSAQLISGVQHVYAATGSSVRDISWGNGAPLTVWQIASFSSPVTSISSTPSPDGVLHVAATAGSTVNDIVWGSGTPLTIWQVANLHSAITSTSSQLTTGIRHIYANTGYTLHEITWGNGTPLTTWQVGNL